MGSADAFYIWVRWNLFLHHSYVDKDSHGVVYMFGIFIDTKNNLKKTAVEIEEVRRNFDLAFSEAKKQRDELIATQSRLEQVNEELLHVNEILASNNKLIADMTHAAGGLICRKDSEGRFLFVNEYQCVHFFRMPKTCMPDILGKTDIDIINEYIETTGKQHSFGDICMSSDEHCKKQKKRCLYVEFGNIDGQLVILKMIKTPIFRPDGQDDGVVCFGWDISALCNGLMDELNKGISEGTVEIIDKYVYWIKDEHTCNLPIIV